MASLIRMFSIRKLSTSQVLAGKPYRITPIVPHVNEGEFMMWKKIAFFVMFPIIGLLMIKCALFGEKHCRPPFIPYEHLRIRNKRFCWGDGNHSLFHNPHVNALPDGYETESDCDD